MTDRAAIEAAIRWAIFAPLALVSLWAFSTYLAHIISLVRLRGAIIKPRRVWGGLAGMVALAASPSPAMRAQASAPVILELILLLVSAVLGIFVFKGAYRRKRRRRRGRGRWVRARRESPLRWVPEPIPPEKPVLVLVHGFMGHALDWDPVFERLQQDFTCLRPILPGHDPEICPVPDDLTLSSAADAIAADLRRAKVSRCCVAGYSLGGRLALHLALQHPELVHALAIESASPGLEDEAARSARREHDAQWASRLEAASSVEEKEALLRDWHGQAVFKGMPREALDAQIAVKRERMLPEMGSALRKLSVAEQENLWPRLDSLQAPCLLVGGREDAKYTQVLQRMAASLPNAQLQLLDAGHNVHAAAPDAYTESLTQFFLAQDPPRPDGAPTHEH